MKPKIIAIVGPTAAGKSEFSREVGKAIGGAILNFDSQQVYRQLNIGTGKVPPASRKPQHYLLDLLDLDETMDADRFAKEAQKIIEQLIQQQIVPILVGGTGLYLRSLLYGLDKLPKRNTLIREKLNNIIKSKGLNVLYEQLREVDPQLAVKIQPKDQARIVRFLEVYEQTGQAPSRLMGQNQTSPYDCFILGLHLPRADLHRAIENRIDAMLQAGWLAEVEMLLCKGYDFNQLPATAIGYQELQAVVQNKMKLSEAKQAILIQTRQYAKRQITWFKKEKVNLWINPRSEQEKTHAINQIKIFLGLFKNGQIQGSPRRPTEAY